MQCLQSAEWLKFQNISPWWLKLALLMLAGLPLISNLPAELVTGLLDQSFPAEFARILAAPLLTFFIWLICWPSLGTRKLLDYISGAFFLAITTVLLSAVLRLILPDALTPDPAQNRVRLIRLFYNILAVFPFSLMFINAFSVRNLIENLSQTRGERRTLGFHLALTLRIFQHVGEVIGRLLLIWREEHPRLLLPRHCHDWRGFRMPWRLSLWLSASISHWIFACIILTFEPIPVMVEEIEQIYHDGEIDEP